MSRLQPSASTKIRNFSLTVQKKILASGLSPLERLKLSLEVHDLGFELLRSIERERIQ